jgi:hypothetical protein
MSYKVTILTDPIPYKNYFVYETAKRIYISIKAILNYLGKNNIKKYRGHHAVTRSLIDGLNKSGIPYEYNPFCILKLTETVIVLSGPNTLRQCIDFKKSGKIKKLIAGPNIVIFSSDFDNLIASKEIDCVITPAEIISKLYLIDNASLAYRIKAWPAGVDMDYWKPNANVKRHQILVYEKQIKGPVGPVQPYVEYLKSLGFEVRIIKYGNYKLDEYKHDLQKSILMVGFVTDESQGIAWAEAWATDVPTFLWENNQHLYNGRKYTCTTAPYLNNQNGVFFNDLEDFKHKIKSWINNDYNLTPRKWCVENMSDEVCAKNLINIINQC